tara:strand:- start:57 stop:677 length:621 start_codon:yes stop_codon:yes gene_type:complete
MNLIFTLVFLIVCAEISASPKFFDYLNGIESLEADFQQEIIDQDGVVLETSQGFLKIKKPNKYRWVFFSPIEQEIVSNGDKIWIHDPELEQVVVRDTLDSDPNMLDFIFEDPRVIEKTYSIKPLLEESEVEEKFLLIHLEEASAIFEKAYVSFNNRIIDEVHVITGVDRTLKIRLKEVRKNTEIRAQEFEFVPTKGTDVVRELAPQ